MSENSIEILGQKLSYPATWQGAASVGMVCICIAFLGTTLDAERIESYSTLFNGTTEEAYEASVDATAILNEQVIELQAEIEELALTANITEEKKTELTENLAVISNTQQAALEDLQTAQESIQAQYDQVKDDLDPAAAQRHLDIINANKNKIDGQLELIHAKPKLGTPPPKS